MNAGHVYSASPIKTTSACVLHSSSISNVIGPPRATSFPRFLNSLDSSKTLFLWGTEPVSAIMSASVSSLTASTFSSMRSMMQSAGVRAARVGRDNGM